jgi:uncharacterized protein (TIGR02145 family)
LETKIYYDWDNYEGPWDEDFSDNPAFDVARAKWGSGWRMPTESECKELLDKCKWERIILVGKSGYMVTGPNGNSIFLPDAGERDESRLCGKGEYGYYWSSTSRSDDSSYCLYTRDNKFVIDWNLIKYGLSVRPVSELKM